MRATLWFILGFLTAVALVRSAATVSAQNPVILGGFSAASGTAIPVSVSSTGVLRLSMQ